jgi:predicted nucleotidyltransferase
MKKKRTEKSASNPSIDQITGISNNIHKMTQELIDKIRILKRKYESEGFIVLGVFGSFARGEDTTGSDIDILYKLDSGFINKNVGWKSCDRIERIQKEFAEFLGRSVDLADVNALDKVGRYFILPEVVYVA